MVSKVSHCCARSTIGLHANLIDMLPEGQTIVITGASSGVGRTTAAAFARRRCRLALAGRDETALIEAAAECRDLGAQVIILALDVRDAAAVEALRAAAARAFGRIDVWVNCAAILLLGRFEDTPPDAFGRVIETNILGYAHGARAALRQFHAQGHEGVLINVGSVLSFMGEPNASAYVASKFAIHGLTACLRQEMRSFPNIHVCLVLPAALDTPIYQRAGNYMGREARSIIPVYDPSKAAEAIVRLTRRPKRQIAIGVVGRLAVASARLAPGSLEFILARLLPRLQFKPQRAPPLAGCLFDSQNQHAARGGWRQYWTARLFARGQTRSAKTASDSESRRLS